VHLESIKATSLLTSSDRPLLRRVLSENERDSVIIERDKVRYLKFYGEPFDWEKVELKKMRDIVDFVSIECRIDNYYVHDIYDEMLHVSKKYFGGTDKQYTKIHLSPMLNSYLKVFQTIGFKLYQGTSSRYSIGRPNVRLDTYSNLSIAKSNAMVLMLLTGETTYRVFNGNEHPIILDGFVRQKLDWEEVKPRKATGKNIDMRNPLISTDIYNPYIEEDCGKKYIKI